MGLKPVLHRKSRQASQEKAMFMLAL